MIYGLINYPITYILKLKLPCRVNERRREMFPNLNAEMAREKLTIKSLAEISGINYESLKLKLRGVTEFKLCEMIAIKKKAFPDKTLDYLFQPIYNGKKEVE